jgi:hypothetical protein
VPEHWSRRGVVRSGALLALPLGAGCAQLPGDTATPPSNDVYGLHVDNRTEKRQTVTVVVERPFEDVTFFEKTLELSGDETRTFEDVLTEPVEQVVTASLDHPVDRPIEGLKEEERSLENGNVWITPGSDAAPQVATIDVVIEMIDPEWEQESEVELSDEDLDLPERHPDLQVTHEGAKNEN